MIEFCTSVASRLGIVSCQLHSYTKLVICCLQLDFAKEVQLADSTALHNQNTFKACQAIVWFHHSTMGHISDLKGAHCRLAAVSYISQAIPEAPDWPSRPLRQAISLSERFDPCELSQGRRMMRRTATEKCRLAQVMV